MSLKKHRNARLDGYQGPYFPHELIDLQDELDERNLDMLKLQAIAKKVPGYTFMNRRQTSDGYYWYWALYFEINQGQIVILVPWSRDLSLLDGSQADRSFAVYLKKTSSKSATRVIKALTTQTIVANKKVRA